MPIFARTIGIDYSGAETPTASLKGLRMIGAARRTVPSVSNPATKSGATMRTSIIFHFLFQYGLNGGLRFCRSSSRD